MQIKIKFVSDENIKLPIHYNSIIQGFIYNNIDKELARFLHDEGYIVNNRTFKLFSFSNILTKGKKEKDLLNFGKVIELIISSPLDKFCKSIANHMLQNENLNIGKNKVTATEINIDNRMIDNNELMIETLSSMVVYSTLLKPDGNKYTHYFMPLEKDFNRIIEENLIKKYKALHNEDIEITEPIHIVPIGEIKQSLVYYKNFIIKGASGKFLVKGDSRLLQIGVDAGFGSKGSQGFGLVKVLK